MALRLTDCHRVSEIPRSVFTDLARRIERGDVILRDACDHVCSECSELVQQREVEVSEIERLAVIEALREHYNCRFLA